MSRIDLWAGCTLLATLAMASPAVAQDLQTRPVAPPTEADAPAPVADDQVRFSAGAME